MAGPASRGTVNGPLVEPPLLSLWSMAERAVGAELDERMWGDGVTFRPESCGADVVAETVGCEDDGDPVDETKPAATARTRVDWDPFSVVAPESCLPFSGYDLEEYRARANRLLEACWVQKAEFEFWTGTQVSGNPHLADAAEVTDITGGATFSVSEGIANIEEAMTDCSCGGRGMLHMTRRVFSLAVAQNLIVIPNDNVLGGVAMTKLGTLVVPGSGYTGSDPDGNFTANTEYVYATGMVKMWRGTAHLVPGDLSEAVDRLTNSITFWAERAVLALFDPCCHLAVEVTAPGGGGS